MKKLGELRKGQKFHFANGGSSLHGKLLQLTPGAAVVDVEFDAPRQAEHVPGGSRQTWSLSTVVEVPAC